MYQILPVVQEKTIRLPLIDQQWKHTFVASAGGYTSDAVALTYFIGPQNVMAALLSGLELLRLLFVRSWGIKKMLRVQELAIAWTQWFCLPRSWYNYETS